MNDAVMLIPPNAGETSLFLVMANRCRNDQRFFASLRMTFTRWRSSWLDAER